MRDNTCSRRYNITGKVENEEDEYEEQLTETLHEVITLNNKFSKILYITKVKNENQILYFNGYEA